MTDVIHSLWPTPVGSFRFEGAEDLNPLLVRMFGALRAVQAQQQNQAPFFASDDDLDRRIRLAEWTPFLDFVLRSVKLVVTHANATDWGAGVDARVELAGMWFQISNRGAFHDIHNHGNCSWSGVYYVQIDPPQARTAHPVYGAANGITRLYGPYLPRLGGAYADFGNAYLQRAHFDVEPQVGTLVVFPSFLEHKAMPYEGSADRVVISFNARVHAAGAGDRVYRFSAV
jgi:hypothetical protein